jgi:hypothetical protein
MEMPLRKALAVLTLGVICSTLIVYGAVTLADRAPLAAALAAFAAACAVMALVTEQKK